MKELIGKSAHLPGIPVSIIATEAGGRLNFAAQGQITTVSYEPDVIAISVIKSHKTAANILETGCFSVNFPTADMKDSVAACSRVSGFDSDKSELFPVFRGEAGIPVISSCMLSFCCKVIEQLEINGFCVFFGEILETFTDSRLNKDGRFNAEKSDPLLCNAEGAFFRLGNKI